MKFTYDDMNCYYCYYTYIPGTRCIAPGTYKDIKYFEVVTVYRLPIRLPAKSALTWPVV